MPAIQDIKVETLNRNISIDLYERSIVLSTIETVFVVDMQVQNKDIVISTQDQAVVLELLN